MCMYHQLEATTNYDERRKIRERIRQVMADKEGICQQKSEKQKKFLIIIHYCVLILASHLL